MGRFTTVLQKLVEKRIDEGCPRDEAFLKFRTRNCEALGQLGRYLDSLTERLAEPLPPEFDGVASSVKHSIGLERELLADLDDLEKSPWHRQK